ncbi:MAG TPA: archaetidylserine decarboxylase [Fibrobacteria bacterium]|jgi:phosphatidylserine decarboxylase|nr:archaetidylserine decarboxylase [Fibrobacteria bacterium]
MYSLLYLIPKNWVSRAVGRVMEARGPFGLNVLIRNAMIRAFKPEVAEAEHPLEHYRTWSEFFVRRLKPGARPVGTSPLVCPVDGTLTQRGYLESPELLLTQIKGIRYSLQDLLAGWDTTPYQGGSFMTVYLAPYNYHRIHAPAGGQLRRALHVPGALWPVNAWSVRSIRGLFVRNDRILIEMDCPLDGVAGGTGRLTIALIGATNVGRTTLSFSPVRANDPAVTRPRDIPVPPGLALEKAAELACFEMGSTIVLVLDAAWTARLRPGLLEGTDPVTVRLGQDLSA